MTVVRLPGTTKGEQMSQTGLSNRELAAACRLEASRLWAAAQRLERKANLIELAESAHDLNAKLSSFCPDYIVKTFEEELDSHEQDREFLAQMCIAAKV